MISNFKVIAFLMVGISFSAGSFFDPSGLLPAEPGCGNDTKEDEETCDGKDLAGLSCAELGFEGGKLGCEADCKSFDTSGCEGGCDKDCGDRECGPDPECGESCGSCGEGVCVDGQCMTPECPADKDCGGRACGPDPVCGESCGTCEVGVCVNGRCDAEASCPEAKDCRGRTCGPDPVCGLSCGSCDSDETCQGGTCVPTGECGAQPLSLQGSLRTSLTTIAFDGVEVAITHARDVDPYEDGCVARVELHFTRGAGCQLDVVAEEGLSAGGGLIVTSLSFSADSQCPNFPNEQEGTYTPYDSLSAEVRPTPADVPGTNVASACFNASLVLQLDAMTLSRYGGGQLTISSSSLTVSGQMLSTGSTTIACPQNRVCDGVVAGACDGSQLVYCDGLAELGRNDCANLLGDGTVNGSCYATGNDATCVFPAGEDCAFSGGDGGLVVFPCGSASGPSSSMACVAGGAEGTYRCESGHASCSTSAPIDPYCVGTELMRECIEHVGGMGQLWGIDCGMADWGGSCADGLCQGQIAGGICASDLIACQEGLSCLNETSSDFGYCG